MVPRRRADRAGSAFAAADWGRPWFAPYAVAGRAVGAAWRDGTSLAQALNAAARTLGAADLPAFVPAAARPAGEPYETFVARTRRVPVRDDDHDAFNGLVWLCHPALKWALIDAHAAEIERLGVGPRRGARRDALTLLDENGALLGADPPLTDALRRRDWAALFLTHRAAWAAARLEVVGHGLLHQLAAAPRKALTAHVWWRSAGGLDTVAGLPADLTPASWLPLPVLGVPGWWPDNADPAFYADATVFRQGTGTLRRRPQLSALA